MSMVWLVGAQDLWMDELHLELSGMFCIRRIGSLKNFARICLMSHEQSASKLFCLLNLDEVESVPSFFSILSAVKKKFPEVKLFFIGGEHLHNQNIPKIFNIPLLSKNMNPLDIMKLLNKLATEVVSLVTSQAFCESIMVGDLEIDRKSSCLKVLATGYKEFLTPTEIKILLALYYSDNFTISRQELIETAWMGLKVSDSTVDSHISRLRKKMEKSFECRLDTIYGEGWSLSVRDPSR